MTRVRQVIPLVVTVVIMGALATVGIRATETASRVSRQQRLTERQNMVQVLGQQLGPAEVSQQQIDQLSKVNQFVGITPSSSVAEVTAGLTKYATLNGGDGAAALFDTDGMLIARSATWDDALSRGALSGDFLRPAPDQLVSYSNVVFSSKGPRTLVRLFVTGWGSPNARNLVTAVPLSSQSIGRVAVFARGGTISEVDANGVVVESTDARLAGTTLPWWSAARSNSKLASGTSVRIGNVPSLAIGRPIARTPWTLVFTQPESTFVTRGAYRTIQIVIILFAALAGAIVALFTYRRHVATRRNEVRMKALLENVGDVVLEVRNGVVRYASPGFDGATDPDQDLVGQPLQSVFGGVLLDEETLQIPDGQYTKYDTKLIAADGSTRHVEVTVANRRQDEGVRGLVVSVHDVTERQELQAKLMHEATHDQLTGLFNRGHFAELTESALARARRHGGQVAMMYLDLDAFKPVNDQYGHEAGDIVLRAVAERIKECIREVDVVSRLGGDEFAVLLDNADGRAEEAAERIRMRLSDPISLGDGRTVRIGVSIGISHSNGEGDTEWLLREADLLMYRVKDARTVRAAPRARG